jgi:hypothetical protein
MTSNNMQSQNKKKVETSSSSTSGCGDGEMVKLDGSFVPGEVSIQTSSVIQ